LSYKRNSQHRRDFEAKRLRRLKVDHVASSVIRGVLRLKAAARQLRGARSRVGAIAGLNPLLSLAGAVS
jgi:hypothetical protein